ncbi:MAG: HEAT repeat domain-containing protein [Nannocystaceae bacterium]|nr:HEAT repeat domain-containing protein [Nannocystaceae bacterium]
MRLAGRLTLLLSIVLPLSAHAAPPRWPSWPSAVDRDAAALLDPEFSTHDRDRVAALIRLQRYPTPLIEGALVTALTQDPSVQVVREALRICYLRRASACLDPATKLYQEGKNPMLQAPALRVISTDPGGDRLEILLEAMLDPSNTIRAEAAQLAGWAPVRGDALARTRRSLLSKISDSASAVRERAVTSLGLQGPGDGTLAIARLLEDPEPDVRAAAAVALGRLGDPKARAALQRAIEGQNEGNVTRAMLGALARVPSEDVVDTLLTFLDAPPPGVGALTVAEAIGDRPHPEPELIDGLVERLRDTGVEPAARRALLWLGEAAAPRLREALDRGLGPRLDSEVRRLLQASAPIGASTGALVAAVWPANDDEHAWADRLRIGPLLGRLQAAAALGRGHPPWLRDRAHAAITRGPADAARSWVLALAAMPTRVSFRDDAVLPWARLAQWALDRALSETDRCVAALALGRANGRHAENVAISTFDALLAEDSARLRACTAWAARDVSGRHTALLLLDADPAARSAAAAALGLLEDAPQAWTQRRRHLATTDPDVNVRVAAATRGVDGLEFVFEPTGPTPWGSPTLWLRPDPSEDPNGGAAVVLGTRPGLWGIRGRGTTSR